MNKLCFILISIALIMSCENNSKSNEELNIIGFATEQSECKVLGKSTGLTKVVETLPDTMAGVEYYYDGKSKLSLTHINAGFNCCPGSLTVDISFEENDIIIEEFEEMAICDCNCLYDLSIEINDIPSGNYSFTFIEPYRNENDEIITFVLGLNNEDSGIITVDRDGYPWGEKSHE